MSACNELTADRLRELLHYDPETGRLAWLIHRRHQKGGGIGGRCAGYVQVAVDGRTYKAHRLAWFYMTGQWPMNEIDHINHDPSDNRFCNLRDVTRSENLRNVNPELVSRQSLRAFGNGGAHFSKRRPK